MKVISKKSIYLIFIFLKYDLYKNEFNKKLRLSYKIMDTKYNNYTTLENLLSI